MTRSTTPKAQPSSADVLRPTTERYSAAKLGVLLADWAAEAILDKPLPGLGASERFSAANWDGAYSA